MVSPSASLSIIFAVELAVFTLPILGEEIVAITDSVVSRTESSITCTVIID